MKMIQGLDHITINTCDLVGTEKFYTEVVGLELAPRPDLGVPGIWLKESGGQGSAIVHVLGVDGQATQDSQIRATLDHVAFHATGFENARKRIEAFDLPWCGNVIEGFGLWQLMFYDPNGVLIELNFKAKDETTKTPVISEVHHMRLDNFFKPSAYKKFLGDEHA
jgi:catechol 2,3-dioxygenase-like lactoylglutathione lyase family enzyme